MKTQLTHADVVVPTLHPRALFEVASEQGADRAALLARTEMTEEMLDNPDARISYGQFGMLVKNALKLTGNPSLGIDYGRRMNVGHLGLLGLGVMSSDTVGAALEMGLKHYRILAPAWSLELSVEGRCAELVAEETLSLAPFSEFATEALLAAIHSLCRSLLGMEPPIWEVALPYPKPAHADRYRDFAPEATIRFGTDVARARFDASILSRPLPWANPVTAAIADRHLRAELTPPCGTPNLAEQVRERLLAAPGNYPEPAELAEHFATSSRSLRRALQRMGTSYQRLLDDARREHAIHGVRSTGLTTEELASRLGFADARSFRRAFKRWTGQSPSHFRSETPLLRASG